MLAAEEIRRLQEQARLLRIDILSMIAAAGSGHPGGSLSLVEIFTALYFKIMTLDPRRPGAEDRDRLVLSKGHAAPVLYAALASRGFFPRDTLSTLRRLGSPLQGHPARHCLPGVEVSTGSLGQGLSVANGMALAARLDDAPWRVYVVLGDGECQEGQVWEAAMTSSHYRLDNLTAFLDYNGLQIDGPTDQVKNLEPLADKWCSFGWNVLSIDGHSFSEILAAVEEAHCRRGQPTMIIAETVKGKGVPFMENRVEWHGVAPNREQLKEALAGLGKKEAEEN
ncbi:MAG: transketolase [Firmicutes bacterium]|nr:transketolase [Bacillota bacterium]